MSRDHPLLHGMRGLDIQFLVVSHKKSTSLSLVWLVDLPFEIGDLGLVLKTSQDDKEFWKTRKNLDLMLDPT